MDTIEYLVPPPILPWFCANRPTAVGTYRNCPTAWSKPPWRRSRPSSAARTTLGSRNSCRREVEAVCRTMEVWNRDRDVPPRRSTAPSCQEEMANCLRGNFLLARRHARAFERGLAFPFIRGCDVGLRPVSAQRPENDGRDAFLSFFRGARRGLRTHQLGPGTRLFAFFRWVVVGMREIRLGFSVISRT